MLDVTYNSVIARWQRWQGNAVLLITGTDEHGQKIQRTAEARGLEPQENCDRYYLAVCPKSVKIIRYKKTIKKE